MLISTGWRRPIGCLKLQVIVRKRATNHRALLWKTTYKDEASYASSPPCSKGKEMLIYSNSEKMLKKISGVRREFLASPGVFDVFLLLLER